MPSAVFECCFQIFNNSSASTRGEGNAILDDFEGVSFLAMNSYITLTGKQLSYFFLSKIFRNGYRKRDEYDRVGF